MDIYMYCGGGVLIGMSVLSMEYWCGNDERRECSFYNSRIVSPTYWARNYSVHRVVVRPICIVVIHVLNSRRVRVKKTPHITHSIIGYQLSPDNNKSHIYFACLSLHTRLCDFSCCTETAWEAVVQRGAFHVQVEWNVHNEPKYEGFESWADVASIPSHS